MGQIVDLILIKSPIGRGFISRYEELIPIHSSKGDWIKAEETRAIQDDNRSFLCNDRQKWQQENYQRGIRYNILVTVNNKDGRILKQLTIYKIISLSMKTISHPMSYRARRASGSCARKLGASGQQCSDHYRMQHHKDVLSVTFREANSDALRTNSQRSHMRKRKFKKW